MVIDLFAWGYYDIIELFLSALFIAITASWACLFIVSIRSHFHSPVISPKQKILTTITSGAQDSNISTSIPFLSIIVPARNEQNNIEKCLLSILSQNYPNFEVIVIDDNSTDNTLKIMKRLKETQAISLLPIHKLKVVSLTDKPDGWSGKTWASEQGYLQSSGNILLFTDADTYYGDKNAILLAVSYMQTENLDVLTGVPYLGLCDFWSKIVMPLWNLFTDIFGRGMAEMNKPKSKVAYLMGSFFIIKRQVFENVGTFQAISDAIQEDKALGVRVKKAGYNIKIVKIDQMVSAFWSRDLKTLWHGIGRTIVSFAIESRLRVVINLLTIFFMSVLPFVLLPYTLQKSWNLNAFDILFFLNMICCIIITIGAAIKGIKKHRLVPIYSILTPFGAIFLIIVYIYNIIPFLIPNKTRSIVWRGRKHTCSSRQEKMRYNM